MKFFTRILIVVVLLVSLATAMAADPSVVEHSFFPYKDGAPSVDGLTPGTVINAGNADQFQSAVDPVLLQQIKDGWVEITVGETTDFALHPNYISATEAGNVTLGETAGEIQNFVAGRAFPQEPDINDPRAGEKLAWNYQYGYNWGDNAAIYPFYWRYRNLETAKIERQIKFNFHFLNWKHRVNQDPVPEFEKNPSGLFRSIYVQVLAPFDVKNTQLLIHRYADDLKRDDAWLYLGFQRRVRRLASGQVTDAFLGSDLMIEDFEGYNGRISDMNWTYKGTQNVILPFYNHNDQALTSEFDDPDGYGFIDFHGKGDCYANVTWQLRKAYVLESSAVDPNHPISKRVHYVDAQTFTLPRTIIYDRKGEPWKSWYICQAHPDHHLAKNVGTGVSIDDCFSMIDLQAKHCTTGQFKGQVDPKLNPVSLFTVQNLRAKGR
ncbi:MAG: DUF1329 domain-containing protein [Xanthomonadales bacterium]